MFPVFVTVHHLWSIKPAMQIAYPKSSTSIHTPRIVYKKTRQIIKKKSYRVLLSRTEPFKEKCNNLATREVRRLRTEIRGLSCNQKSNNQTEETQNGTENLNDENLDEPADQ